jgi:8-amino-7-oxononanoate synthase
MAFDFISSALTERREQSLFRRRQCIEASTGTLIKVDGQHYINFASNDYLGMRQSMAVMQGWVDGVSEFGGGSGASALVTGYTQAHQALENYLAEALGREQVLLFNSGFAANQAICQALFKDSNGPAGSIVADKLIHASLIDGALASEAKFLRYRHNDLNHLQQQLTKTSGDTLVVTEGVFSMDGDQAPLLDMLPLVDAHQAWLMLDDAHGFGVLGETGMGCAEAAGLSQQQLPVLMATFGKAIGTAGAFVAGSRELIDYLSNFARHYIYSTAMPPAQATATLASLKAIRTGTPRFCLHENIQLFKQLASAAGIKLMLSDSPIQPVIVGNAEEAVAASERLKSLGIWVSAIRYPTVPKGTDRLRVTIGANHQAEDIIALVDALQLALRGLKSCSSIVSGCLDAN